MRILLMSMITAACFCQADAARAQTGSSALRDCTQAIRLSEGINLSSAEGLNAMSCVSYVSGFVDAIALVHGLRPKTNLVCLPQSGLTNEQSIRILVKFLRSNPEKLHESARISLFVSLAQAFPCAGE